MSRAEEQLPPCVDYAAAWEMQETQGEAAKPLLAAETEPGLAEAGGGACEETARPDTIARVVIDTAATEAPASEPAHGEELIGREPRVTDELFEQEPEDVEPQTVPAWMFERETAQKLELQQELDATKAEFMSEMEHQEIFLVDTRKTLERLRLRLVGLAVAPRSSRTKIEYMSLLRELKLLEDMVARMAS